MTSVPCVSFPQSSGASVPCWCTNWCLFTQLVFRCVLEEDRTSAADEAEGGEEGEGRERGAGDETNGILETHHHINTVNTVNNHENNYTGINNNYTR